ncbi:hypothetical protein Q9233_013156 [Columba guinea]|nr:hypothetical protein Q9233_013156 [Columba guinea]
MSSGTFTLLHVLEEDNTRYPASVRRFTATFADTFRFGASFTDGNIKRRARDFEAKRSTNAVISQIFRMKSSSPVVSLSVISLDNLALVWPVKPSPINVSSNQQHRDQFRESTNAFAEERKMVCFLM